MHSSSVSFNFLTEMSDSTEVPSPHVKADCRRNRVPRTARSVGELGTLQRAPLIFESSGPEGTSGNRALPRSDAIHSFWWNSIFPLSSRKNAKVLSGYARRQMIRSSFPSIYGYRSANDRRKLHHDVVSLNAPQAYSAPLAHGRGKSSFLVLTRRASACSRSCTGSRRSKRFTQDL